MPTQSSILRRAEAEVRTATLSFLRTERRTQLAALREALAPEDQTLLILRVDRKLSWEELAVVLGSDPNLSGADALKREAARLRKRFQIVKSKLRKQAVKHGLLSPGG
jgi:RNA polymerase sigma-70 factor (ECF subfamily)